MIEPHEEDMMVHLTVDDARTAQAAGIKFARTLAGAYSQDFALALAEQAELIERAITDAGHATDQAGLAAGHFEMAAWDEWQRIADAGSSDEVGSLAASA
jgi:myosin-crossreactive antigen